MNEQDKKGPKLSRDEAKKRLALALLARYDPDGAEAIAKRKNLPFDLELAFKQIEAILGKEEADAARVRWSPEAEEESYRRAKMGMERKAIGPQSSLSVLDWLHEAGRKCIALFEYQLSLNLAADAMQFKELPLPDGDRVEMAWDKSSISLTPFRPSGETSTLWVSVVTVDKARQTVSIIRSMPVAQHAERFEPGLSSSQFTVVISRESLGERL